MVGLVLEEEDEYRWTGEGGFAKRCSDRSVSRTASRRGLGCAPGKSSLMLGRETFFGEWGDGDMVVSGRKGRRNRGGEVIRAMGGREGGRLK